MKKFFLNQIPNINPVKLAANEAAHEPETAPKIERTAEVDQARFNEIMETAEAQEAAQQIEDDLVQRLNLSEQAKVMSAQSADYRYGILALQGVFDKRGMCLTSDALIDAYILYKDPDLVEGYEYLKSVPFD